MEESQLRAAMDAMAQKVEVETIRTECRDLVLGVGERQSDENAARVAEIIDSLRREVVGPRRGRQQASRVVVQTN